ncbi:MAG: hypothetical protein QMB92_06475, partial [Thiopseudomonas sp.]
LARRPVAGVEDIGGWRDASRVFLQGAQRVFVPSEDALRRFGRYFPEVRLTLGCHEPALAAQPAVAPSMAQGEPLRVLVLGALSVFKGADVLEQAALAARGRRLPLEFHLLGYAYRPLRTRPVAALKVHGAYRDEELQERMAEIRPHVVWFAGSCPETWSYTLSSTLAAGLPVVAPAIGAFPERLAGRGWSWLIPVDCPLDALLEQLLAVRGALLDGQAPQALPAAQAVACFEYAGEYAQDVAAAQDGESDWPVVVRQWLQLPAATAQPVLLAHVHPQWLRALLVFALKRGWLGAINARIPPALRQAVKARITR